MEENYNITTDVLKQTLEKMILSASGWRGLFNIQEKAESNTKEITRAHSILTVFVAMAFCNFIKKNYNNITKVVLGRDTRPTGEILEKIIFYALKKYANNLEIYNIGISPIPEAMSYARVKKAAFFYVSASHNPIGYNGFKFGTGEQGVFEGIKADQLIKIFKDLVEQNELEIAKEIIEKAKTECISHIESAKEKDEAFNSYLENAKQVISGNMDENQAQYFFEKMKIQNAQLNNTKPIYIACDFNGSARASSIDKRLFESLNLHFISYNDSPCKIEHGIIPEGENLNTLQNILKTLYKEKNGNGTFLGYMPDCDGDRGNVVYIDDEGNPQILQPQQVFALAVISEIVHIKLKDNKARLAVVANGPTSMLIEDIASSLSFEVFRAEVGEANVVNLAKDVSKKGYITRILGEGSNGGCIVPPSLVRDPLNTLFALLKFFLLNDEKHNLFKYWLNSRNKNFNNKETFSFSDIVSSIPKYVTTPVSSERAILKVKIQNQKAFRKAFQNIFINEWKTKKEKFKHNYNFEFYKAFAYVGKETLDITSNFSLVDKGGVKIIFYNDKNDALSFIWMRASGTEPVFRIMADIKNGTENNEKILISWEKDMITQALNEM